MEGLKRRVMMGGVRRKIEGVRMRRMTMRER